MVIRKEKQPMTFKLGEHAITDSSIISMGNYGLNQLLDDVINTITIDQLYDHDFIKQWVKDTFSPEDVFDEKDLIDWADRYGYNV